MNVRGRDTYKGETMFKKVARINHLGSVAGWYSQREDFFRKWCVWGHVVLASREGGDIGAIRALGGLSLDRIFALDRVPDAVQACDQKWRGIADRIGEAPPKVLYSEDAVADVDRWLKQGSNIAHVFWDFCSHIDRKTIDAVITTWRGLPRYGCLTLGVLKGREKVQKPTALAETIRQPRWATRKMRHLDPFGSFTWIESMIKGNEAFDPSSVYDVMREASITKSIPKEWRASFIRSIFVAQAIGCVYPSESDQPALISVTEYQSERDGNKGVPMLYMTFVKGVDSKARNIACIDQLAVNKCLSKLAAEQQPEALGCLKRLDHLSLLFNVEPSTIVAWKAHATRGTYAR